MKADEFDNKFEAGEMLFRTWTSPESGGLARSSGRVNVDFPVWMIHSLDKEAKRLGVPRQSPNKVWIAERLETTPHHS